MKLCGFLLGFLFFFKGETQGFDDLQEFFDSRERVPRLWPDQPLHQTPCRFGDYELLEEIAHGLPQGFRAVENHQQAPVGSQSAALEIRQQRLAEGRIFRRAFP